MVGGLNVASIDDGCSFALLAAAIRLRSSDASAAQAAQYESAATAAATLACPNCQTPSQGGRFCHECGFDMASTHKSCPACGVTMMRQARFCTDCGHAF